MKPRSSDHNRATPSGAAELEPGGWPADRLSVANLGHATLLMNFLGVRVISDPTLFTHVGFSFGSLFTVGPKRLARPPLRPDRLGPLDLILITHAHMDHLDLPSLAVLPRDAVVVGCGGFDRLIEPLKFRDVRALRWNERTEVRGLTVTAMGARHWGKRWPPFGIDYGYNSYVLEKNGCRMLLACDSAETDLFSRLAGPPPAAAAFSIGAYDPYIRSHANPEQVWRMFESTGARWLVPIHWGTFRLSREPMGEPLERLIAAAGAQAERIAIRRIGAAWTMPAEEARRGAGEAAERSAARRGP